MPHTTPADTSSHPTSDPTHHSSRPPLSPLKASSRTLQRHRYVGPKVRQSKLDCFFRKLRHACRVDNKENVATKTIKSSPIHKTTAPVEAERPRKRKLEQSTLSHPNTDSSTGISHATRESDGSSSRPASGAADCSHRTGKRLRRFKSDPFLKRRKPWGFDEVEGNPFALSGTGVEDAGTLTRTSSGGRSAHPLSATDESNTHRSSERENTLEIDSLSSAQPITPLAAKVLATRRLRTPLPRTVSQPTITITAASVTHTPLAATQPPPSTSLVTPDNFALPCHPGREDPLFRIKPETLSQVISGELQTSLDEVLILDCRYRFEYDGGHIQGARHVNHPEDLHDLLFPEPAQDTPSSASAPGPRTRALVFHCEFSSHRGPEMARWFVREDRWKNRHRRPHLDFPEIYVLEGGYASFYGRHSTQCQPSAYVRMHDPRFSDENVECTRQRRAVMKAALGQRR